MKFNCSNIRDSLNKIHDCAIKSALKVNGSFGYDVKIWFPVCNPSIYGRYGNSKIYGDETHVPRQWDSPRVENDVDRADHERERVKLDHDPKSPKHYAPDFEGRLIITGLESMVRFEGSDLSVEGEPVVGDPYGGIEEILMLLPTDLAPVPDSKVQVILPGEILHFHTQAIRRKGALWSPTMRRVLLIPSEDETI